MISATSGLRSLSLSEVVARHLQYIQNGESNLLFHSLPPEHRDETTTTTQQPPLGKDSKSSQDCMQQLTTQPLETNTQQTLSTSSTEHSQKCRNSPHSDDYIQINDNVQINDNIQSSDNIQGKFRLFP